MNFETLLTTKGIVEMIAALLMLCGLFGILINRAKQNRGLTTISIQFLSIVFVFPTILIMSLESVISGETSGTLIGALAGYLFSEFGKQKNVQNSVATAQQSNGVASQQLT